MSYLDLASQSAPVFYTKDPAATEMEANQNRSCE